ncbi:MAG: putative glucose/L-sorbosone dehydrogenase, distantly related to bacterial beta-galactosidase [Verrucomicrobiales bacterium]|nr:putative glucose/L-sorbosone dehydrogenase, distantly related to bacterial beta-galactosidase [Verrucomicrobiales bacterium]
MPGKDNFQKYQLKTAIRTTLLFAVAASCALSLDSAYGQFNNGNRLGKDLADYRKFALSSQADAARGKALFFDETKLACSKCHTVDGKNGKAGPDLFAIGDKYPRPDLMEAILQPSANIAVGYTTTVVSTKSGEEYTGILQQLNDAGLDIMGADGKIVHVAKNDIKEQKPSSISLMPEGLHAGLTLQQFNDLLEYLITLRQPESNLTIERGMPANIPELSKPANVTPIFEKPLTSPRINGVESGLTGFTFIPGQSNAWLVTHQVGLIWLIEKTQTGEQKSVFADLVSEIYSKTGPNGLLGITFHPKFNQNRKYYLKYQVFEDNMINTTIVEKKMAADYRHDSGEPARRLIKIPSLGGDHGGGCLQFGPDGYLYFAMGDSGPHRDPNGNAQNMKLLLGKMSRIDVDHQDEGKPYSVPKDNPFIGKDNVRPEIWALGFRNPWRFSFDPQNGDLWLADVGQDRVEEVDIVRRGENYGWNVFEAFEKFSDQYRQEGANYIPPIFSYKRKYGNSVTGGCVYRGDKKSSYNGVYIFADYTSKRIFGMTQENRKLKTIRQIATAPQRVVSFARDEQGELYVVCFEGTICKLDLASSPFDGPVKELQLSKDAK